MGYAILQETAEKAARAAGDHAAGNIHRRMELVRRSKHDVKLALDFECQQVAERVIVNDFGERHAILGEEGGRREADRPCWIIDPLDGTVNFSHGLPQWCSSVAVQIDNAIVAGAVFVPPLGECFTARLDGPALLNGEPVRVSQTERLEDAMITTGLPLSGAYPNCLPNLDRLGRAVQKVRIMGAAAIDLCNVACGRVDAYLESSIHLWDVAAAGLVVRRAGGHAGVLRYHSQTHYSYLGSNARLHTALSGLVEKHRPGKQNPEPGRAD